MSEQIIVINGKKFETTNSGAKLNLSHNNLESLSNKSFDSLTNLQTLYLSGNNLESLPDGVFDPLTNLQILHLYFNNLESLPDGIFDFLTNLQILSISHNNLKSIPGGIFDSLTNLQKLSLSSNNLKSLPDGIFDSLTNLQELYLSHNNLESLPPSIRNCRRLSRFNYSGNPIEYIPPRLQRFIDRLENRNISNISNDSQNVHDSIIQRSMNRSISNLLSNEPKFTLEESIDYIMKSDVISDEAKSYLVIYSDDETVHSVHDVTFAEVLRAVISEISESEYSTEIMKVLSQEIMESECKCFTGRISRLVNSLNGFSDKVKVEISNNTQLSTILSRTQELIGKANSEEEISKIKSDTISNLQERGISKEEIDSWMEHL